MEVDPLPIIEEIEGLDAPPRMSEEINPQYVHFPPFLPPK